jgi:glyoxylase-like metal-dependent hydrolase (beta-lactamase superfamily II)
VAGVEYPSNQVTERNGAVWMSTEALDIAFNGAVDEKDFAMDAKVAAVSVGMKGWAAAKFSAAQDKALAEGIDLFLGSWNTTIVKEADGVVILETPISGNFTEGILAEAKRRYPDAAVKAVLSTSDSWPHVGGVRADVSEGLPVYVLDLNEPLLERMVTAPHAIDPDALERAKKTPVWKIVAGKTEIGTGANRMVLYPLRGASTERQYMVYFPERRLLYASDTLVVNDDHTIRSWRTRWNRRCSGSIWWWTRCTRCIRRRWRGAMWWGCCGRRRRDEGRDNFDERSNVHLSRGNAAGVGLRIYICRVDGQLCPRADMFLG